MRALNTQGPTGGGKNMRFSIELISKTVPMVAMERYRQSLVADRFVSVQMTLNDLERSQIFQADLLNNARAV